MIFFSPFLYISVRFGIGATISTHLEIQCLPYAGCLRGKGSGAVRNMQETWFKLTQTHQFMNLEGMG